MAIVKTESWNEFLVQAVAIDSKFRTWWLKHVWEALLAKSFSKLCLWFVLFHIHGQNLSCAHRSEIFPTSSLTFQLLTNCTSDKLNSSSVTEISGRNLYVRSNKRKIIFCCQHENIALIGYNCWSFKFNLKKLWTRKQVLFCSCLVFKVIDG